MIGRAGRARGPGGGRTVPAMSPSLLRLGKLKRTMQLKPPGTPPETLVADPAAPKPRVSVIAYAGTDHEEVEDATIEDVKRLRERFTRVWVNVDGLGDADTVRAIGELFRLHKLALEDVLSTRQRPKVDEYEDHVFMVLREPMLEGRRRLGEHNPAQAVGRPEGASGSPRFDTDQIGLFLGRDFVVTFQEYRGDCLNPVRQRIRAARGRVASAGPDFLVYSMVDAVVDAYFPVLEVFGENLEDLESDAVECPSADTVHTIHAIKRELLVIRRTLWPMREAVSLLLRDETPLVSAETRMYLRDAYDHLVQLIDIVENERELGSDLMDIYLSSQSHRLNEVMKVLTIIATIFMPLSFIAGVYGMNFDTTHPANMPELHWKYGYAFAWALMIGTALVLVVYFWRKGWIMRGLGRG